MPMEAAKRLLCGRCRVRLEILAHGLDGPMVRCPTCGESDTVKNALREAGQHVAHTVLSSMLRGAASGLGTPATRGPLHFRFIECDKG